jgi:hypothetical protein
MDRQVQDFVEKSCILQSSRFCNIDHFMFYFKKNSIQEVLIILQELYPSVHINYSMNLLEGLDLDHAAYFHLQLQMRNASST